MSVLGKERCVHGRVSECVFEREREGRGCVCA